MVADDKHLTDESLRLLVDSMSAQLPEGSTVGRVTNMLIEETVRFRDKLKQETGEILTVRDTRSALEALARHLGGEKEPPELTPEQKALSRIWIDRLTLFRGGLGTL